MKDQSKTKQVLIQELVSLRQRIAELKQLELEHQQLEKTLHEVERLQLLVFEHSSDVIYTLDCDLRVTSVSTSVEQHLGYRTEELVGRQFKDINMLAPESLEAAFKNALQTLAGGTVPTAEYVFIRKDGSRVIGEVSGSPLVEDGKIVGLISVARDITDRKRAEEALRESEKRVRRKLDAILSPEADIGALELSDIIDREKIQKLMDEFYQLTNIGIGIIDLHGRVLVGTGWQDICTKFHRINPESCRLCIESDLELNCNVPVGTFKQYRCKNSMWDIATPIMLGDRHVGNIFLGQFLFDDETPDYETFRQQACRYGFNEQEYIEALDRVPRWSREKVNSTMTFYTSFAGMIGNLSYSNVKLAHALEERKRTEEELSRVNRALQMLSHTNQALVRIRDEATLLSEICRIVVEVGGYRLAWVGFAEQDEVKTVRSAAHAGFDSGYIESANVTWADNDRGRGPGGTAIRTGQPCMERNISRGPAFAPWREEAIRRGYQSIIALPLISDGRTLGALGIYSSETDAFDAQEVEILKELANDLALGITALRTRAKRDLAEEALRHSEKEKTILNQIATIFLTIPDEEMYGEVLAVILQAMRSKYGIFGYIGGTGNLVIPSLTRDIWNECQIPDKSIIFPSDSWGNSLWGRAIREKKAFYSGGPFHAPEGHVHIDHFLAVPIVFGQETIGLLSFANKEGGYTEGDKDLQENIANFISPILNARLQRDIQEQRRKQAEKEKRSLEERLQRAEKMESLGILAGGVAHDLNNVLGIVVGYSEILLMGVDKSSPIRSKLVNVMEGGQKAAAIVNDLLTLARRGVQVRSILNLNKIVTDCQKSPELADLSNQHPSIKIKTELDPDLLNISCSPVHLGKTIFNLTSNASEAMPKGGVLTIKTANQYLDKPIQGYDEIREGDYVVLSVSDTGEGINTTDLKRVFEPFYTNKVMGRSGTGLGLAVVWGTVKDHNGYINLESEEGKGSTFTLYFPVTREELSAGHLAVSVSEYMGKGESILVVDDVKGQRDLAEEMFRRLNYRVTSVSSGEEAVAYLKEHKADLMVLDMIMDPGMDGLDTYRSVLEIYPRQKAIIVSGFSESDRVKAAQALGAGAYVKKPYVIEKLGLAVRKELDRSV